MKTLKHLFLLFLSISIFVVLVSQLDLSVAHAKNKKKVTTQQAQIMQTKTFDAEYKRVFKTTMSVLQDNNFIITSANFDAGFIHAQTGSKSGFGADKNVSASVNLDEMSKASTQLRINMMLNKKSTDIFLFGGASTRESGKPVTDDQVYSRFFTAMEKELFIRDQLAK